MTVLTVPIDENRLQEIQEAAAAQGMPVEEMVRRSIDEYMNRRKDFVDSARYVLEKNAELYRRLARGAQ